MVIFADGHLELTLPNLEITNMTIPERPSPAASPVLQQPNQPSHRNNERKDILVKREQPQDANENVINNHTGSLALPSALGSAFSRPSSVTSTDTVRSLSPNATGLARAVTPDMTPTFSLDGTVYYHATHPMDKSTILSPGIPGLLPPLISSTPYMASSNTKSEKKMGPVKAEAKEESKERHFRPWEHSPVSKKPRLSTTTEQNTNRDMTRSVHATSEVTFDPDPVRTAMVIQHSKLVADLTWFQKFKANEPEIVAICRMYSQEVEHTEMMRHYAIAQSYGQVNIINNVNQHFDLRRLEMLRMTSFKVSHLKTLYSMQYGYTYQVPGIPAMSQPINLMPGAVHPYTLSQMQWPMQASNPIVREKQAVLKSKENIVRRGSAGPIKPKKGVKREKTSVYDVPAIHKNPEPVTHGIKTENTFISEPHIHDESGSATVSHDSYHSGSTSIDSAYHSGCSSPDLSSQPPSTATLTSTSEKVKLIEEVEKLSSIGRQQNKSGKPSRRPSAASRGRNGRLLNGQAVELMEKWYSLHFDHPYPNDEDIQRLAKEGNISVTQVKKWMANKRVRSYNTLSFNGTVHPRKLRRLQKQHELVYDQLAKLQTQYSNQAQGHNIPFQGGL